MRISSPLLRNSYVNKKILEWYELFFSWAVHVCVFFLGGGEGRTKGTGQLRVGVAADVIHEVGDPPKTEGQCCWWMLFFFSNVDKDVVI